MGYHRAGFDVVGVDIEARPRYPFEFVQADAMAYPLEGFDAIHASPPCQAYSIGARANGTQHRHPDLLPGTRKRLDGAQVPWVIENVVGAPMRADFVLCGCMFDLWNDEYQLVRTRWFETSWHGFDLRSQCCHSRVTMTVLRHGARADAYRGTDRYGSDKVTAEQLMGIDWMTQDELGEAIPPAYTEYIGRQLLAEIGASK